MNLSAEEAVKREFMREKGEEIVYIVDRGSWYGIYYFDILTAKYLYTAGFNYESRFFLLRFIGPKLCLTLYDKIPLRNDLYKWKSLRDNVLVIVTKESAIFRFYFNKKYDPVLSYDYDSLEVYRTVEIPLTRIQKWYDLIKNALNERKIELEQENKFELKRTTLKEYKEKYEKRSEYLEIIYNDFVNFLESHRDEIDEFISDLEIPEEGGTRVYE